MNGRGVKHIPLWTLLICAGSIALWFTGAAGQVQYDRSAIAAGQWWRSLGGHLSHWSADHLLWDVAAFAVLGVLAETHSRRRFLLCAVAGAVAVSAAVWFLRPDLELYRGLSGIDSALFALVAATMVRDAVATRRPLSTVVGCAVLAGLGLKIAWELSLGTALFVDATTAGFESVPLAHAAGAVVGLPIGLVRTQGSR